MDEYDEAFDRKRITKPPRAKGFGIGTQRKNVPPTKTGTTELEDPNIDRNTIFTTNNCSEVGQLADTATNVGSGLAARANFQLDAGLDHITNCVMVDTLGLELVTLRGPKGSRYGGLDEEGEAVEDSEWSKGDLRSATGKQSLRVRHVTKTKKLSIEGSNAVHVQGHNVVSSGDVTMTAFSMLQAVNQEHELGIPVSVGYDLAHGHEVEVTRIDVALLLKVPDGIQKSALINALAIAGIKAGNNTGLYVNESVYFDQGSQVESQKIYDKELELQRARKGGLPDLPGVEQLEALTQRTVRLEAVFRKKRLVNIASKYGGPPHPCLFTQRMLAEMVLALLKKFTCAGQVFRRLEDSELLAIPLPYRSTVAHWQNHMNLGDMVKSERVLREHKEFVLRNHAINLNAPPPDELVVPMSLTDILSPENFIPVPPGIRQNNELFYELNMDDERQRLQKKVSGIARAIVDPYSLDE